MSEISESVASGSIGFRQSLPQDVAGKLSLALKYKEEGTVHFKAGNFKKAIATYAKVTAFTKYVPRYLCLTFIWLIVILKTANPMISKGSTW